MNSSTDESKLWKRLVWFEAIFLKKNAPKLLKLSYSSAKRSGERATWFCSLVQIVIGADHLKHLQACRISYMKTLMISIQRAQITYDLRLTSRFVLINPVSHVSIYNKYVSF